MSKKRAQTLANGEEVPLWVLSRRLVKQAAANGSLMAVNMAAGDFPGFVYKVLNNPNTQLSTASKYAAAVGVPLPKLLELLEDAQAGEEEGGGDLPNPAGG